MALITKNTIVPPVWAKAVFCLLLLSFTALRLSLKGQSSFVDSSLKYSVNLPDQKAGHRLFKAADAHFDINLEESKTLGKQALIKALKSGDKILQFNCLLLLSDLSMLLQEFQAADSLLNVALGLAETLDDSKKKLTAKIALAKNHSLKGEPGSSISMLDEVIRDSKNPGDSLILGRALMAKGISLYGISAYEAALESYYKALAIFTAIDDTPRAGIVQSNIGVTMLGLKRLDEALVAFEESSRISKKEVDPYGLLIAILNLGVVYQKMGRFDEARRNYLQALEMAQKKGSWQEIGLLMDNLGTTAMEANNLLEARSYLQKAIHIQDSIGYFHNLPHAHNSLAEISLRMGDYAAAQSNASKAEKLARQLLDRDQLSEALRLQAKINETSGNYPLAYNLLLQHKALNDSIFSLKSDEAISNLNIRYKTAQKENEIQRLASQNEMNQRQKAILAGVSLLVLITAGAIIYALYTRRHRDKLLLQKEHELHERQNRFFANISHEFRTPLTLISGPVQNLKSQVKDEEGKGLLHNIEQNADRLLFLINEILDLSKFDQKELTLKKEVLDWHLLFSGMCASFSSLAEDRGIHYSYKIADNLPLLADRRRLEIVLVNLLSNAFKFTPDGGSISIKIHSDKTNKNLLMTVKDTGPGIAREDLSRIFERYYHDDQKSNSVQEGIGIGLALSKNIVELHGGRISVSSELNVGSVFLVNLPMGEALPQQASKPSTQSRQISIGEPEDLPLADEKLSSKSQGEKPLILLVEDGSDMRKYLSHFLRKQYTVFEAANADEGWHLALKEVPDLVISDVMMPGRTGLEFCCQLKTDVRTSHIPVLLLTAKATVEDRLSGLETEADVYLTKPFIPEELLLHLQNLLKSRLKLRAHFEKYRKIEPAKMSFNSIDEQFLQGLTNQLEEYFSDELFSVEELSEHLNLSRSQLHRKIKALTGETPTQLIRTFRLSRAKDMVASKTASIAEISYAVGFSSPAYFSKCFLEEFKATPTEIRDRS